MSGLNRVMLLGNLGDAPELRHTPGGASVLEVRMATTVGYTDHGERKERTDWHTVVVFGNKRAEALSRLLVKGSQVFVEGSLRTSSYEDRDGKKRYKTEVIASNVLLCGGRAQPSAPVQAAPPASTPTYGADDEIPF